MSLTFGVVDLFAGPGGLGEGFAGLTVNDHHPFRIVISAEMEASAHRTLRLRAWVRAWLRKEGRLPPDYVKFHAGELDEPALVESAGPLWDAADREARQLRLGEAPDMDEIYKAIRREADRYDDMIVIGGPPCQAYSLVGRARNKGIEGYRAEEDHRHYLFREYIRVLRRCRPAVFVMENVRGMLSASVGGHKVFDMLLDDLRSLRGSEGDVVADDELYELIPLSPRTLMQNEPADFLIRSEEFGVPQRRHRVIIVGLRKDVARRLRKNSVPFPRLDNAAARPRTVRDVLSGMPALRSGLSREQDSSGIWRDATMGIADFLSGLPDFSDLDERLTEDLERLPGRMTSNAEISRSSRELPEPISDSHGYGRSSDDRLASFLENRELAALAQHETRAHIRSDLTRYMFAAAHAGSLRTSPKAGDFPDELRPDHENWKSGKFADRFRVQLWDQPSTTVTSHISKDGHYFIHPDPAQCRSLTVREAARLQTFPDDYYFMGNRTQQFVQVGNAVPPYLARQIAHTILQMLQAEPSKSES